ncbi:MAG: carboxypeptidase M32 [Simkaniaceae bacterium]|nr:MAG: carboxypeptidase M32 [Simkaniaceae bacterium]
MGKALEDYEKLKERGKEIYTLASVLMLLEWDQETKMPIGGASFRASQIELLSSLTHKEKTSDSFKKALEKLIDLKTGSIKSDSLDERKKGALREFRTELLKDTKLPSSFVKKLAKANSEGTHAWQKAKNSNTFESFLPNLETIVELNKEKAELLGYDDHPYDALLDLYEPGMTTKKLDTLFGELKPFLTNLTKNLSNNKQDDNAFLSTFFPIEKQMEFCREILKEMGVDPQKSRLDTSVHPFCLGVHPTDVRLTTFTSATAFFTNLSAVMHEGGHALYELGLPPEDFGTPLGSYCSIAIHESQSRWWECFIGQSRSFCEYLLPKLQKAFPSELKELTIDPFTSVLNQVKPSLIRVFADEVTYILHIIIRYEIEKDFLSGSIDLKDLPKIWNEKMKDSLGIVPETDAEGCLQDVHWSFGLIGYFPTYALGNLYAGQLFETFKKDHPDFEKKISAGDLSFIRHFLLEKIHRFGRELPPLALIEKATGHPLSPKPYIDYLTKKYTFSQ